MEIVIYAHGQVYGDHWPGQPSTKRKITLLTSEYIHALEKLDIAAKVIFNIDSLDNVSMLADKDLEITVETANQVEKNKIWEVINPIRLRKQREI